MQKRPVFLGSLLIVATLHTSQRRGRASSARPLSGHSDFVFPAIFLAKQLVHARNHTRQLDIVFGGGRVIGLTCLRAMCARIAERLPHHHLGH